jgi:hypothetical protein
MSRDHIRQLISAVQNRVRPSDHLPLPPAASPGSARASYDVAFDDEDDTFVVPPDWQRPKPPDWVLGGARREADSPIQIEPDDEITIETVDERGELLTLPGGPDLFQSARSVKPRITPPFDVHAYYLPFHFYRERWGIYIRASGILDLVRCIVERDFLYKHERWIVEFAAKSLFLHEFFHHSVEVSCSRLEYPLSTTPSNWGADQYSTYFNDRLGSYVEEAVANAYLTRSIDRYHRDSPMAGAYTSVRDGLLKAMDHQPEPYSHFRRFLANDRQARGRDSLVDRMSAPWLVSLVLLGHPRPSTVLGSGMYFADITPVATHCPIYVVVDTPNQLVQVGKPFPKGMGLQVIVHTNDHPPPHIHVRDLSQRRRTDVRYVWPSLQPYAQEERLSSSLEKNLNSYVLKYYPAIAARVQATYGSVLISA